MFKDSWAAYRKVGLLTIPTRGKAPFFRNFSDYIKSGINTEDYEEWSKNHGDSNIALLCGSVIPAINKIIIAVDIDNDKVIDIVENALMIKNHAQCTKRGAKGKTIFVVGSAEIKNKKYVMKGENRPSVEILARGAITILPPSIHPDTQKPYEWTSSSLCDVNLNDLPTYTIEVGDEIYSRLNGKGEVFDLLDNMEASTENQPGSVHDTILKATAFMVAKGWKEEEVIRRVSYAYKQAYEKAGKKFDKNKAQSEIHKLYQTAKEKGFAENKDKIPAERIVAKWIIDNIRQGVFSNGALRRYDAGYWRLVDMKRLEQRVYQEFEFFVRKWVLDGIKISLAQLYSDEFGKTKGVHPQDDIHHPSKFKVALLNGTLNMRTMELEEHSPINHLIHQLDINWDADAKCDLYDQFVNDTFQGCEKSIALWDEFCGWTLVNDMRFHKVLFLLGPGGNGKGTLSRVLMSLHDPEAIGSVGITDLNDERKRTSLVGKLVNVSGEQSRMNQVADAYLKKITGGDPVDVRRLYGETQNNVYLTVRFLELVNEMPAISTTGEALKRRLIILNCNNKVDTPDIHLTEKLLRERSGILRRWATALKRLYERGEFDEPQSSKTEVENYLEESDSIQFWLNTRCTTRKAWMGSSQLYLDYKAFCESTGIRFVYSQVEWGKKLKAKDFPAKLQRVGVKGAPIQARHITLGKDEEESGQDF